MHIKNRGKCKSQDTNQNKSGNINRTRKGTYNSENTSRESTNRKFKSEIVSREMHIGRYKPKNAIRKINIKRIRIGKYKLDSRTETYTSGKDKPEDITPRIQFEKCSS